MNQLPRWASFVIVVFLQVLFSFECNAELPRQGRLNMGFYSQSITDMASRSDIEVSLNFWAKDLIATEALSKLNIKLLASQALLFDSMEEIRSAYLSGNLDMIIAPPLLISRYFKKEELADGFTGMLANNQPDNLLLISRSDQAIDDVKDLVGKRLVILDNDELAHVYLDSLFFQELHKGYKKSAKSVEFQKKGSRIVLDVYFNKADAGVVYRNAYEVMVELNPDIAKKVVVLNKYPIKSRNFSFFVHGYPFVDEMSSMAVTTFENSARAKQILDVFRTPELEKCSVKELDQFIALDANYNKLKLQADR